MAGAPKMIHNSSLEFHSWRKGTSLKWRGKDGQGQVPTLQDWQMERLYLMLQILKILSEDTAIHFKSTLNSQGWVSLYV